MQNTSAIRTDHLERNFGGLRAVNDVSFEVQQGEIFSLLGPNGAGKSTIISMLSCLLDPSAGDAYVMGHSILQEPMQVKRKIGVVPQDIALYPDLTARENLAFWGKMYGLRGKSLNQAVERVLDLVGLQNRQKDRVNTFSGGMKRRINIAIALMHEPEVVIMDEPTVGIDPQSRRHILDNVQALNREGMSVLYTTHYMEEAQELSDRIAIMDHGKIIASGTNDELVKLVGEQDRIDLSLSSESAQVIDRWQNIEGVHQIGAENGTMSLLVDDSNLVLPRLFETATEAGTKILAVAIQEPNLEAVFLHLTGRKLRD